MKNNEYTIYKIPKRNGGYRIIEAPNPELKKKQEEILLELYKQVPVSPFCHGGVPFRSIVTNAFSHVKQDIVASVDIVDFFPSIFKLFVTSKLKKLTNNTQLIEDVDRYCFLNGRLPQGAPTSPYLANIALIDFDWQLASFCCNQGIQYTRYFDDITISGPRHLHKLIAVIIRKVIPYMLDYKFNFKTHKTKIISGGRKLVCGVVVNEKLNVPRAYRRKLRAEIHQKGLTNSVTIGKYNYVEMVRNTDISKLKTTCQIYFEWLKNRRDYALLIDDEDLYKRILFVIRNAKRKYKQYKLNNNYLD